MAIAGDLILGEGTVPAWLGAGKGQVFFDSADGQFYARRSDTGAIVGPIGTGGGGSPAGPLQAVYLAAAPRGNDGTGTRGDPTLPFLTLKAAIAACQSGDVLYIGPGTFPITAAIDVPVWPLGLDALSIVGSGRGVTILSMFGAPVAGMHLINPVPTAFYLEVADLTAQTGFGAAGSHVINADGSGGGGSFMDPFTGGGLFLRNVILSASGGGGAHALHARFCAAIFIDGFLSLTGETHFLTSNVIMCSNARFFATNIFWDDDDVDRPSIGRAGSDFDATSFGAALVIGGQADVVASESCKASLLTTGASLSQAPVSLEVPRLEYRGSVTGNVVFDGVSSWPDATVNMSINFSGMRCSGTFAIRKAGTVNPANPVQMRGAFVQGALTARQGMDVTAHGALMGTALFATPDPTGSITPSQWVGVGFVAVGPGPTVVPFGFRAQAAPITALAGANALGAPVAVTAMTPTDVTVDITLAGSASIVARWI
jgi:hypothetical protein